MEKYSFASGMTTQFSTIGSNFFTDEPAQSVKRIMKQKSDVNVGQLF